MSVSNLYCEINNCTILNRLNGYDGEELLFPKKARHVQAPAKNRAADGRVSFIATNPAHFLPYTTFKSNKVSPKKRIITY